MNNSQQQLFLPETEYDEGQQLLQIIAKGVERFGIKSFAGLIDIDPSQLRHAFNGTGKYFSITWLARILKRDKACADEAIEFICNICNKEIPADKKELTVEEKLERFKYKVKEHHLEEVFKDCF